MVLPNIKEIKYKNKTTNDIVIITYTYDKTKKLLRIHFLTDGGEAFMEELFIKNNNQIRYIMFAYYSFVKALASMEFISIKKVDKYYE